MTERPPADSLFESVFEHTAQFMVALAPDGTVLRVNRAALQLGGLAARDVVGVRLWDCGWWGGDAAGVVRSAVQRAAAGEFVREDIEVEGADGPATLDFSLKHVAAGDGTAAFLIAQGHDVTETRWSQRALRVSQARFAGIISIASDAIISVDENFQITLFNQGAEAIFGYTSAGILGQRLDVLLPERFRGGHDRHVRNFAASPVVARRMGERQEILGRRADGSEFPAEASISKLDLPGSTVFTVVLRDITDRKLVERSQRFLAQAGKILASSLDYETTLASVGALTVPELADWSIVYIRNEDGQVRRLEIAHADTSLHATLHELLEYPLMSNSPHPVFTVLETGEAHVMADIDDAFIRSISGDDRHFEIYRTLGLRSMLMVPLVARGRTQGAMGFFSAAPRRYGAEDLALAQDLAVVSALAVDNARLYRDARSAVQARDDLIAVVSHDLGNPLSAIRIGTSLLLRSVPESDLGTAGWQHLAFIRESAQQMENLINDLLDVKRLEAGSVRLQRQPVAVHELVSSAAELFRPIATSREVEFRCSVAGEIPPAHADPQRVAQVLGNIVGNALKFTQAGGTVELRARAASGAVLFSVTDTGPGIPEEHLAHIFDRFWQARREGRTGLGLGLAIARGIVDAHGGRIWAESELGKGTTFLFTIPLSHDQGHRVADVDETRPVAGE